jgi:hypothetical protein
MHYRICEREHVYSRVNGVVRELDYAISRADHTVTIRKGLSKRQWLKIGQHLQRVQEAERDPIPVVSYGHVGMKYTHVPVICDVR